MSEEHTRLMGEQLKVLKDIKQWTISTGIGVWVLFWVVLTIAF
jgi:hypothetical protein